jgi:GMP synthase-like glutamine amidotransferase
LASRQRNLFTHKSCRPGQNALSPGTAFFHATLPWPIIERDTIMRILVFQHVPVEHPGAFCQLWRESGDEWCTVELDAGQVIPDLNDFDLLVAMGGPMDVWQEDLYPWLGPEKAAIRHWVKDLGRPFLGVCLGHQLLAVALGGVVRLMDQQEIGLGEVTLTEAGGQDPLFAGFAAPVETFQWHGAEISQLPDGAEVLAMNSSCPVQAFRYGPHAYGLQYHVEITASTVAEWSNIPEYRAGLERVLGPGATTRLSELVAHRLPSFAASARRLNDNISAVVMAAHSASPLKDKRLSA